MGGAGSARKLLSIQLCNELKTALNIKPSFKVLKMQ